VWIAADPALDARGTPSEITAVNDALSNSEPEVDLDLQQLTQKPLPHRGTYGRRAIGVKGSLIAEEAPKGPPRRTREPQMACPALAPRASRRRLRRLSSVARFHCVRVANRFARNGTSGFLSLSVRARNEALRPHCLERGLMDLVFEQPISGVLSALSYCLEPHSEEASKSRRTAAGP
jgi:hypothetical protein